MGTGEAGASAPAVGWPEIIPPLPPHLRHTLTSLLRVRDSYGARGDYNLGVRVGINFAIDQIIWNYLDELAR